MISWEAWVGSSPIGPLHAMTTPTAAGPPILFLHGVTRSSRDWMGFLAGLVHRWQPVCLDFRGHGESARCADRYLVGQYVEDAVYIARHFIDQPMVLFGHSLGAMVACAAAERLRDRVLGVILEDPPFETLGTRIRGTPYHSQFVGIERLLREKRWKGVADLAKQLADVVIEDPVSNGQYRLGDKRDAAALRFHARCLAQMDPDCLTPIIEGRWLEGFPWARIIERIEAPILVLQADPKTGGMLIDDDAHEIERRAHDALTVRFEGMPHSLHQTATSACLQVVHGFLESLPIEHPY